MAACLQTQRDELLTERGHLVKRIDDLHTQPISHDRDRAIWALEENRDLLDVALNETEQALREQAN
ncbi:hypothetical protein [Erythrobacter aureus]|uniref:Uncharacterized protein n=1 Tax=Erythrobacter aureus TaxID=2182384 RepID=A0A345YIN9_9SPHN|nr:hypothetical protein [Erythrobacter aureus]AXK43791.1 hypothetical protein DVR09_15150 [Erythrobacter aureus]